MVILRILIFILIISQNSFAQKTLQIGKATNFKSLVFFEGDNIRFKRYDDDFFISSRISGFSEDKIKLNNIEIPLSSIEYIDIRHKSSNFFKKFGTYLSGASAGYFIIDFINLSVVQKASSAEVFDNKIILRCSLGIGLGFGLRQLKRKYFKRKKLSRVWIQESI